MHCSLKKKYKKLIKSFFFNSKKCHCNGKECKETGVRVEKNNVSLNLRRGLVTDNFSHGLNLIFKRVKRQTQGSHIFSSIAFNTWIIQICWKNLITESSKILDVIFLSQKIFRRNFLKIFQRPKMQIDFSGKFTILIFFWNIWFCQCSI